MTKKFFTFDVLAVGGKDLRKLPFSMRTKLLARRPEGVFLNP
jgi:ATP-dependent DNA ligase